VGGVGWGGGGGGGVKEREREGVCVSMCEGHMYMLVDDDKHLYDKLLDCQTFHCVSKGPCIYVKEPYISTVEWCMS